VKQKQDSQKPAIPSGRRAFFREGFLKLTPRRKTRHSLTQKMMNRWKRDLRRAAIIKKPMLLVCSYINFRHTPIYIFYLFFYSFLKA
jgi:hypothetical protein